MASDPRTYIATLRESHDKLESLAGPLTPDQVRGQSYAPTGASPRCCPIWAAAPRFR